MTEARSRDRARYGVGTIGKKESKIAEIDLFAFCRSTLLSRMLSTMVWTRGQKEVEIACADCQQHLNRKLLWKKQ